MIYIFFCSLENNKDKSIEKKTQLGSGRLSAPTETSEAVNSTLLAPRKENKGLKTGSETKMKKIEFRIVKNIF